MQKYPVAGKLLEKSFGDYKLRDAEVFIIPFALLVAADFVPHPAQFDLWIFLAGCTVSLLILKGTPPAQRPRDYAIASFRLRFGTTTFLNRPAHLKGDRGKVMDVVLSYDESWERGGK